MVVHSLVIWPTPKKITWSFLEGCPDLVSFIWQWVSYSVYKSRHHLHSTPPFPRLDLAACGLTSVGSPASASPPSTAGSEAWTFTYTTYYHYTPHARQSNHLGREAQNKPARQAVVLYVGIVRAVQRTNNATVVHPCSRLPLRQYSFWRCTQSFLPTINILYYYIYVHIPMYL